VANYGNKILFASSRAGEGELTKKTYAWNEQPYLNIYEAQRNTANGNLTNDKLFEGLNSQYHDAMICFNKENTRVYFSTNQLRKKGKLKTNEDGTSTLQIMLADVVEGKIANIVSLSINSEEYSCSHPMLSEDGKFLYFVSNMENGMGETDIYRAPVKADGTVGSPKNLGPKINTPGREMFPTLQEGKLYFSSDGHYGIGGLDLFASKIKGDNFENPENLGRPFNSEMDDFNIYWTKAGVNGYLSSNRLGGKGDDDIYFFTKDDQNWYQDVFGNVKEQTTKEIIPFATVKVYDDLDSLIAETQADSLGRFEVQLPCSSTNRLVFSKENHSTEELDVTTPDTPKVPEEEDAEDVYLTLYKTLVKEEDGVEKIIVNPIYFDYDKAEITPQAEVELNRVIDAMNKFPSIVIKIESHTDARGKDSYNLKLSDDRAKSTRDYLIEQGIDPNRIISAVGYGEQQIKNKCKNGVECTDDEHFVNRRSDFIVVKK
ncbi:OmpA family protein, partial [Lishizhenia sp.]|uniref:OmpA family protein n=1 Tax=Lishizhenia sp. TaxID=2497594 RepID=UPI00299F3B23